MPDIEWEVVNVSDDVAVAWFTHKADANLFVGAVRPEFPDVEFKVRRYKKGRG